MMTEKQATYIKALMNNKEYEMTPDVADYTNTYSEARTKEQASTVIEYLLECDDKEVKESSEARNMIIRNKKKIVNAINNKKKVAFVAELRKAGVKITWSNQYVYFTGTGEKVEPKDVDNETAEAFIEIAQKHVRGLK